MDVQYIRVCVYLNVYTVDHDDNYPVFVTIAKYFLECVKKVQERE
jgi:hypothetical protein